MAFSSKLSDEGLAYFEEIGKKKFSEQAVAFLNAYWPEVGNQAEFIFSVSYEFIKKADMHAKGIQLIHKYEEGTDVDFDIGLYFYEKLCKFLEEDGKNWSKAPYEISQPEMMTALKRKQELRDKVDVNFDGRVSFLEYLLYQYQGVANPADFVSRSMNQGEEHPELRAARLALEEVAQAIREFEAEKYRLSEEAKQEGVKGLRAKNLLAQLDASPLAENLNMALIKAEAALRAVQRKLGSGALSPRSGEAAQASQGAQYWYQRQLDEDKKRYGKKK